MSDSLNISVKLLESNKTIADQILKALIPDIRQYLDKIYNSLKSTIPLIVIESIKAQPEYTALLSGTLQYELGIVDPGSRLKEILATIESGAIVSTKPLKTTGSGFSGGVKLQMVKSDFSDLLNLGSASFVSENGSQINWLEWLLIEGDSVIISDYDFILGPSKYSRTGMGIMRSMSGGSWRVPPEYAGTANNNWITRAIEAASQSIQKEIEKISK